MKVTKNMDPKPDGLYLTEGDVKDILETITSGAHAPNTMFCAASCGVGKLIDFITSHGYTVEHSDA